jgi:DNA repair protein RecO (recombination protein O)
MGSPEFRLAAVVLARANAKEADLVVTFLTRELGLLTAVAKNARKSVRRFGGGLLNLARAAWYDFKIYPNSEVALVVKGEDNPEFPITPAEPVALALSAWAMELTRSLEAPGNPAPLTFNLIIQHLSRLAQCSDFHPPALEARRLSLGFTKCYLEVAGFGPTLTVCHHCGQIPEKGSWSWIPAMGSVFCPQCRAPLDPIVQGELLGALGAITDHLACPDLSDQELAIAESFFAQMATLASGRFYKSRRVLIQLLIPPKLAGATNVLAPGLNEANQLGQSVFAESDQLTSGQNVTFGSPMISEITLEPIASEPEIFPPPIPTSGA